MQSGLRKLILVSIIFILSVAFMERSVVARRNRIDNIKDKDCLKIDFMGLGKIAHPYPKDWLENPDGCKNNN